MSERLCEYNGLPLHPVDPAVCEWHIREQDPLCAGCPNAKDRIRVEAAESAEAGQGRMWADGGRTEL